MKIKNNKKYKRKSDGIIVKITHIDDYWDEVEYVGINKFDHGICSINWFQKHYKSLNKYEEDKDRLAI